MIAGSDAMDDFPPDFALYAFTSDGGLGVAVSHQRNEVVYWSDN